MTSPPQSSTPEPSSLYQDGILYDEIPLGTSTIDPYGRRSMAYRREVSGKTVTQTELDEERWTPRPTRNYFRRQDVFMVLYCMEWIRPRLLKTALQVLSFPLIFVHMGVNHVMLRWDVWRSGGPISSDKQD